MVSPSPPSDLPYGEIGETPSALLTVLGSRRSEFLDFLRRRMGSEADPEDVLQSALVLATRRIGTLRRADAVVPWFYRILRRSLADHHAVWAVRRDPLRALEAGMDACPPEEAATCGCSPRLIGALTPQYEEMLRRVVVDEEELSSVAASLGLTLNNATVRLHRARKALRERLLRLCGTTSSRTCLDCACNSDSPGPDIRGRSVILRR